ncbi:MAG: hypothetical protein AAGG81_04135 [Chlamydiota bacterium]
MSLCPTKSSTYIGIFWVHEDSLNAGFKGFEEVSSAIFVWDNNYFQQMNYSLKRLVFIYETLLELPIEIWEGNTVEVLEEQSKSKGVYVVATPNPLLQSYISELSKKVNVSIVKDEPFVENDLDEDYTRFFPYWNRIRNRVLDQS